jgi:fumarate hydratase subunit alpha
LYAERVVLVTISAESLVDVSAKLYEKACKTVPPDVREAVQEALRRESNELARLQLQQMLDNIEVARQDNNVICQDTGIPYFFIKYGTNVTLKGDLRGAIAKGMKKLYEGPPRIWTYHVDPFTWKQGLSWEGTHTPFIYVDLIPDADYLELRAFPKGTGSSMWGKLKLDEPRKATPTDIKRFVLESLLDAGPRACPPYIIGVGVGGTLDYVAYLAKVATTRSLKERNANPTVAAMEQEILEAVNKTAIGVMGLGGDTTALAVNIEYASTHFYRTPLAFELNCWPGRQASAKIYSDGTVEYG